MAAGSVAGAAAGASAAGFGVMLAELSSAVKGAWVTGPAGVAGVMGAVSGVVTGAEVAIAALGVTVVCIALCAAGMDVGADVGAGAAVFAEGACLAGSSARPAPAAAANGRASTSMAASF